MIIKYGEVEFQCRGEHLNGVGYKDIDIAYQVQKTIINMVGQWDDSLRRIRGKQRSVFLPSSQVIHHYNSMFV